MGALSPPTDKPQTTNEHPVKRYQRRRIVHKRKHGGTRLLLTLAIAMVFMTIATLRLHLKSSSLLSSSLSSSGSRDAYSHAIPFSFDWDRSNQGRIKRPAVWDELENTEIQYTSISEQYSDWTTPQGYHKDLCGSHAKDASQRHPRSFSKGHVLSSSSRVMISGILSPVGMHLAMRLVKECGVQNIMGIDSLMPRNHRMEFMERYALLRHFVPTLERLVLPFVGIIPKDQADQLQIFRPTHLVHLHTGEEYSNHNNTLFQIRHCMVSMDQLFGLAKTLSKTPAIVYVHTEHMQMDHIIASTYHRLYGVASNAIQLPQIYGPWGQQQSWAFSLGEQIVQNTTIALFDFLEDEPFLFVDDAVDGLLAAMQFQRGAARFQLGSHTTKTEIEHTARQTSAAVIPSKKSYPNDKLVQDYLGWVPATSTMTGTKKLLAWHYYRAHPYGEPTKGNPPIDSSQYHRFPCASECALTSHCRASVFDTVVTISKRITHGCKYALYMQNLAASVNTLPLSTLATDSNFTTCRIAFVSGASPLVKELGADAVNGVAQSNGWSLVWMEKEASQLSVAELAMPKLSPGKFFSNTVSRAIYVDVDHVAVPAMDTLLQLIQVVDAPPRKAKKMRIFRSGTSLHKIRWIKSQAARIVILFGEQQIFPFSPVNHMSKYFNYMVKRDGVQPSPNASNQIQFYDQVAHFLQTSERRMEHQPKSHVTFPYQWVRSSFLIHNLREEEGRLLRCEWYDEQVTWGNSKLDEISLAYILAKRRVSGLHASDQHEWTPLLKNGERLQTDNDKDLFVRFVAPNQLFPAKLTNVLTK